MTNEEKISTNLILKIILDSREHDIYEFHCKHRIPPSLILKSLQYLDEFGIVDIIDNFVVIKKNISNEAVSFMNDLSKTSRPVKLNNIMFDI
jgi:hypothetical protein